MEVVEGEPVGECAVCMGIDWGEQSHAVVAMTVDSEVLGETMIPVGIDGVGVVHELVAGFEPGRVSIGIETDHGLLVQALVAAGYDVVAINPKAASRYRDRHSVSGAKSDMADAWMLANVVRTDGHLHRRVAADSVDAAALKVLSRAHQRLVWDRQRLTNRLRSKLLEFYPAAESVFAHRLCSSDAVEVLAAAPTPTAGRQLTRPQIRGALKRGGRQRYLDSTVDKIQAGLRSNEHLSAPEVIEAAHGLEAKALARQLRALNEEIAELETELESCFRNHPDAEIYLSVPGFGVITGARVLAEFGDDPNRYRDPKSRRNYAGTSPINKQSGRSDIAHHRKARNHYLASALDQAAFSATTTSNGATAFYNKHRAAGASHHGALRALANKLVSQLHGCLQHHTPYNEHTAWQHQQPTAA